MYYLAEPSAQGRLAGYDLLASMHTGLKPDGSVHVRQYAGPPALKSLLVDSIKMDVRATRVIEVAGMTQVDVPSMTLQAFERRHGVNFRRMAAEGQALRDALLARTQGRHDGPETYAGMWGAGYLSRAFAGGTPARPVRLRPQ
jgi:hypothetical protein